MATIAEFLTEQVIEELRCINEDLTLLHLSFGGRFFTPGDKSVEEHTVHLRHLVHRLERRIAEQREFNEMLRSIDEKTRKKIEDQLTEAAQKLAKLNDLIPRPKDVDPANELLSENISEFMKRIEVKQSGPKVDHDTISAVKPGDPLLIAIPILLEVCRQLILRIGRRKKK